MVKQSEKMASPSSRNGLGAQVNKQNLLRVSVILLVVLAIGVFVITRHKSASQTLTINSHKFVIEIADTRSEREQGLSGRSSLDPDYGLLFVFDKPDQACFWMKDMRFNLDILWFDADKKLIYLLQNLAPSTYPNNFCPPKLAKYVLEINAGEADKLNIKNQDSFSL